MKQSLIFLFVAALALTSCHTSKNVTGGATSATTAGSTQTTQITSAAECVKKVSAQSLSQQCLTAKLKVNLQGMGKEISVNGNLRMKRDDVVQITLSFLGIEVGRLEFTPQDVLIVDRMNKQYVRASYNEVGFLKTAELDFYSMQSLFWNELFVPGQRSARNSAGNFTLSSENGNNVLTLTHAPRLVYSFFTSPTTNLIEKLVVKGSGSNDKGTFAFAYSDFQTFGNRQFPRGMEMQISGLDKKNSSGTLSFSLSRLSADSDWQTRTTISSKYTRRSAEEVLGKLIKAGL